MKLTLKNEERKTCDSRLARRMKKEVPKTEQCAYINCCYMAEELECFGYKSDCILYMKSNGRFYTTKAFDLAVDRLIDKAKAKHELLKSEPPKL